MKQQQLPDKTGIVPEKHCLKPGDITLEEAIKPSQAVKDNAVVFTVSDKSVVHNKLKIEDSKKSIASENTPAKVIDKEKEASAHKKVHFSTGEYVCSKKCETLHVNLGHFSNLPARSSPLNCSRNQSILSDKVYFFCCSLNDGGIDSAKFSMVISFILLYCSIQIFFYDDEEGSSKMVAFFAGVYALCYVHCARKLISGIHKELKHKFIAWIGFSIMTIFFLFSGAFYVLICNWDELESFHKDLMSNCQTVALIFGLAIIGCIMVYCTRIVLLLWKSMHFEEEPHSGSCFKLVRDFGALHAFSLNSFSRHAAH